MDIRITSSLLVRSTAVLGVALLSQGCMLSRSVSRTVSRVVGTVVNSVSDAAKSSSDRLSAQARTDALQYHDDFRLTTRDLVARGAAVRELQRELGRVADLHGVLDWEQRSDSLHAIGLGACQGGASPARLDSLLSELEVDDPAPALDGCRASL